MSKAAGFTLIEVLVSIAILGIIATVSIPNFKKFNSSQTVVNWAKNYASALITARTNIESSTKCPNPNFSYPHDWDVVVQSNGYYLRANCKDPNTGTLSPGQSLPFTSFPTGISATFQTCNGWSGLGIDFLSSSVVNDCSLPWPYQVTITDGSNTSVVQIDSAGNVTVK